MMPGADDDRGYDDRVARLTAPRWRATAILGLAVVTVLSPALVSANDDVRIRSAAVLRNRAAMLQDRAAASGLSAPGAAASDLTSALGGTSEHPTRAATSIEPGSASRSSLDLEATYEVGARLGYGSRSLRVDARLTVTNTSGEPIDRLELNTVAARLGSMRSLVVTVDDAPAAASVRDQTITVPLGGVLPVGAAASVRVRYAATLRSTVGGSDWLFTRANGIVDLYRWIPWISRPVPFDRANHGDPFVTPASPSVRVTITTDRPLRFATTGRRTAVSPNGLVQTFVAENVRDFTATASPDYRIRSVEMGDNLVRVFARPGTSLAALSDRASWALRRLESLLGPYPYRTLTIAESAGGYGMEAPGLVWVPRGTGTDRYPFLVTHEVAHQWFYGIVGNDQAAGPFADEAPADFLARYLTSSRRSSRCSTARLDLDIRSYSRACYYEVVYVQGGNLLDDLRRRMGNGDFWGALRGYLVDHRFGLGSTQELLDALDDATPLNLVPALRPRFPSLY